MIPIDATVKIEEKENIITPKVGSKNEFSFYFLNIYIIFNPAIGLKKNFAR